MKKQRRAHRRGELIGVNFRKCSQAEMGQILLLTPVRLNEWQERGMPVEIVDGKKFYDPAAVLRWRIEYERELVEDSLGGADNKVAREEYWKHKAQREKAEAARAARKNRMEQGEIILKSDLRAGLAQIASVFRGLLESGEPLEAAIGRLDKDLTAIGREAASAPLFEDPASAPLPARKPTPKAKGVDV